MASHTLRKASASPRKGQSWKDIDQSVKPKRRSSAAEKRVWADRLKYSVFAGAALALALALFQLRGVWLNGPELLTKAGESLPIERVIIETDGSLPLEWIERRLAIGEDANLLSVDLELIKESLEEIGQVSAVRVERLFPDALHVSVSERIPVVRLLAQDRDGSTLRLFVDESGSVFEGVRVERSLARSLPYIGGVALKRSGNGFSDVEEMAVISELLSEARAIAPHLYGTWRIVSPGRQDTLQVKNRRGTEIVFSLEDDFRSQLAKLDYITDYYRSRMGKEMSFVDLTLGDQVPVESELASR